MVPSLFALLSTQGVIPLILHMLSTKSYQQLYSLGQQTISLVHVSFTVMALSKAVVLGLQPFCTVPTRSTARLGLWYYPPGQLEWKYGV